jgi:diamine N-acetyltransferase
VSNGQHNVKMKADLVVFMLFMWVHAVLGSATTLWLEEAGVLRHHPCMNKPVAAPPAVISQAGAEHLEEIAALAGVIWRVHYPGIISSAQIDYMLRWMYGLETMREELARGIRYDRLLIGNVLAGFSSSGPIEGGGDFKLHKMYIHPEWQRRGLGELLLRAAEENARGHGAQRLVLAVNKRNSTGIAAYLKWNFKIESALITEIGSGFVMDDYILVKNLQRIG